MEAVEKPPVFLEGELGIFIGHADDASSEAEVIKKLQGVLQEELNKFRTVKPEIPWQTVKCWEWTENAPCETSGQTTIDPAIDEAAIAVFVFKGRIGRDHRLAGR